MGKDRAKWQAIMPPIDYCQHNKTVFTINSRLTRDARRIQTNITDPRLAHWLANELHVWAYQYETAQKEASEETLP